MSKLVYICHRNGIRQHPYTSADIQLLSKRLAPDNIHQNPPLIIEDNGILIGVVNPVDKFPIKNQSVCLGQFFGANDDWWKPGAEVPDGTYALLRSSNASIELVSDIVVSRTIWYIKTEEVFIASTSQRAIILLLKSFEPNENVYPWMLSTGSLGPGYSWDKRIKCLRGDSRLLLDRRLWKITIKEEPIKFFSSNLSDKQYQSQLLQAIEDTFHNINIDIKKWVLPISGGVDSRALLLMLKDHKNIQTITWGIKSSLQRKNTDARIARQLAEYFSVDNKYLETDQGDEPEEIIFDRFLKAGEGRVDNISGYMDGFKIWKYIFEAPYSGVIRGDQAFGCYAVRNAQEVYKNMSFRLLSDYGNINSAVLDYYNYQHRPVEFEKQPDETLEAWRDRLYTEFEIPTIFAALNDLKLAYVEVINPFFSRRIINQVRQLPDHLRTNKSLFKSIVNDIGPDIRYAKHPAIASRKDILCDKALTDIIYDHLNSSNTKNILPTILIDYVLAELDHNRTRKVIIPKQGISSIPGRLKRRLTKGYTSRLMDPFVLMFRTYIIARMSEILAEDANILEKG